MKLSKNVKQLRDAINQLEKSQNDQELALYLLASKKKKVRIVRTSPNALKTVQGDMYPGSAIYALADLAVALPLGKGMSLHVPLCDLPEIVGQLSEGLSRALILAENAQKRDAQRAYAQTPPVPSPATTEG